MFNRFLCIFACFSLYSSSILPMANNAKNPFPFPFVIQLDTTNPIKIEPGPIKIELPDFTAIGGQLGAGAGDFFSKGARTFADATNDKEYHDDLTRGMTGLARNMGDAVGGFNAEAESSLFPEMATTFRGVMGSAINKRNALQFGSTMALSIAVTVTGYYLTRFIWDILTHKVLHPKPVILLPETNYGRIDRLKRWWNGYTTPSMIFDTQVKDRLFEIEAKTKLIRTHNKKRSNKKNKMNYDNLLLYGKPGTGKTLFARVLADHINMDFVATTAASLLQSGTAGVKYVNDIMSMARRSSYGVILFIDEADALFVDRETLNPDSDHYKILSHLLALTGEGNSTFMLIAATNHPYIMDNAMGRRFQDRILMPLPDAATRKELFNLYIKNIIFNAKSNGKQFVQKAKQLFNEKTMDYLVGQTEGLSHSEIKDIVHAIHRKARISEQKIITEKQIKQALEQAVEKHHMLAQDQQKKEQRFHTAYAHAA